MQSVKYSLPGDSEFTAYRAFSIGYRAKVKTPFAEHLVQINRAIVNTEHAEAFSTIYWA